MSKFIVFEGVDGAGKSTILEELKKYCLVDNIDSVFTREPGGSSIGSQMRALIDKESKNVHQNHDLKYLSTNFIAASVSTTIKWPP